MKELTEEQIKAGADIFYAKDHPVTPAESSNFEEGVKWHIEMTTPKVSFLDHVSSVELPEKDKNLIKGLYYGWLKGM